MPIITIVLNFSDKRWNAPKDLLGLLNVSDDMKTYIKNYEIEVFDIAFLEDEVIESFTSDFKLVAQFFKKRRLGQKDDVMSDNTIPIEHVEATLDLLKVFSSDNRYAKAYTEELKEKVKRGENVYMCEVAEKLVNQGKNEERTHLYSLINKGVLKKEDAASEIGITVEELAEEMKKAGY